MNKMPQSIEFVLIAQNARVLRSAKGWSAYLNYDRWDDWSSYCTQFYLTLVDPSGAHFEIGQVKVGQKGMKPAGFAAELPLKHRKPDIPESFNVLGDDFFSIGQDEEYYQNLGEVGDEVRALVLLALKDVAYDVERWNWAKDEDVMSTSLLHSVTSSTVEGQFRRLANGDARVTRFDFSYTLPKREGDGGRLFTLKFGVNPESSIPTNIHVLIGRNGVGKTRLLSLMIKALVAHEASARQSGKFQINESGSAASTFANVVAVSFSAFDDSDFLADRKQEGGSLGFSYIGLKGRSRESSRARPKSPKALAEDFVKSLRLCRIGARAKRWRDVISILESDPIFKSIQIKSVIDIDLDDEDARNRVLKIFNLLSSGHKIVLLTLTRLVEKVEERTLVLIDEPEGHLHPPLLSAMTRAISRLLVQRNGVAIIATHSPVILQEVPKSCVWVMNRTSRVAGAERPTIETFAENVGILSREVFRLELVTAGFYNILREVKEQEPSYEDALEHFNEELGAEGRAVLRAMYLED